MGGEDENSWYLPSVVDQARPPLVIWFSAPPRVARGVFNAVSKSWGNDVIFACHNDYRQTRQELGWAEGDFGAADVRILSKQPDLAKQLMYEYSDAVHVFAGFDGPVGSYLAQYAELNSNAKIAVFSERPGSYGPVVKRMMRKIGVPRRYKGYRKRFGQQVSAYLPLGQLGMQTALEHGWPAERLFPFMYCPLSENPTRQFSARPGQPVRILYVGRFSRYTKGTDVLIRATDAIEDEDGWSLHLVGGYGDLSEDTIKWANGKSNVEFLGSWQADAVVENMKEYDVCVVPSRFDGWNVVINEAIAAGIGVIASDETVSGEMVTAADAGLVVAACDVAGLADAMSQAIRDRTLVDRWRANAIAYAPRVAPNAVATYFNDVMDYAFADSTHRPSCPWL